MTVSKFYELFEEHRAAGFPDPEGPTPTATPTITPTPTPSLPPLVAMPGAPDYVKWQIGADVPSEVAEAVVEGTRLTHEYVVSLGLPEIRPDVEIYLHGDLDALASLYARLTGRSVEASREHWRNGYVEEGTVGIPGFWIIVKTSHPSWVESAYLPNLTILSAHELLHAYQDELSGLPASGVPDDEVPFHGPSWATEGIAEFFAYKASDAGGVLSYDTKRANSVSHAKNMEKPLRGMETWEGGLKGYGYDLPLLGAELLASYAGEDALLRFYMLQRPGTTWQEAFETAFGMTVEEFYGLFEEHRAAGFPDPEGPTPTDTPKPEPVAHPSDILDWFADPPDDKHSFAANSIERMWDLYPDLGVEVARLNWVGDGITWNEEFVLEELSYVVSEDPELVRAVVNQEHRSYLMGLGSESAKQAAEYPWLANELDARELYAIIEITRIAARNPGFAELVLGYPWLADGITEAEARGLGALSRWALLAPELVDRVLKYTWLDDGITDAEKDTLSVLYSFAERGGVEATKQVMDYQWLADGVTWDEYDVIAELAQLIEDDPEAAIQISRRTLVPYLLGLVSESGEQAAEYPWLADGLDARELRTIIGIAGIAKQAQELAERLLGYTWLADGVSQRESNGISTLADIAHVNLELARQVVGMGILDDPLRDRDLHAITSLSRLIGTDDIALLTSQPWFTDGLSDEETAFLVVTNRDQHSDSQYRDFLRTHFTRSATISLPLAGDVDLWVFWHLPFPDSDDSIELIEDAVRALEALMGVPFPTTDIILLLGDPDDIWASGYNAGSHMAMDRIVGEGNHRGVVYHETAHYYSMGIHSWFNEGFADLAVTYTMTRVGLRSFAERENYLEEYDLPECIELGFRNIQELLDKGGHACLGEFILVSLFNLLGEEAMSAALRELYLMSGEQGEEDFYRIFLKHTPLGLEDEFRDLYRWLHGGPYADGER